MVKNSTDKPVILVTGADGQLGSSIRERADDGAAHYLFTDFQQLDITDAEAVDAYMERERPDVVVNCAAYTNVDAAEDHPQDARRLNRDAVANLARACAGSGATLIHISTDYVFDGRGNEPLTEELPTRPMGVYGRTKLEGEAAALSSGCECLIIRTSWLYSEYGHNFMKTTRRVLGEGRAMKVVFDQTGTPTYAGDLALALCRIVEGGLYRGHGGVCHYSNEGVASWYDFAVETALAFGLEPRIAPCRSAEYPVKAVRPAYSVLDKAKFRDSFGMTVPHWREALYRCAAKLQA